MSTPMDGRTFRRVQYKYRCEVCGITDMTSANEITTQKFYLPQQIGNDFHSHDGNRGLATLTCVNGHNTTQPYKAACECGWSSG